MRLKSRSRISASVLISSVFARPGHADQQTVTSGEQRDQHFFDDLVLADDDFANLAEHGLALDGEFFDLCDFMLLNLVDSMRLLFIERS